MASHNDNMHESPPKPSEVFSTLMNNLVAESEKLTKAGQNQITVGKPGEEILENWNVNRIDVNKLPDDKHGVLRISIGGISPSHFLNYCTIRGDVDQCIELLENALDALRKRP